MSARDYLEKDFYAVLGVTKTASADEIKKAYRKLAREFHPDANAGDAKAEEKFKEISEAYDVLSDDAKRREYDEMRQYGGVRSAAAGSPGGPPGGFGPGGATRSTSVTCSVTPASATCSAGCSVARLAAGAVATGRATTSPDASPSASATRRRGHDAGAAARRGRLPHLWRQWRQARHVAAHLRGRAAAAARPSRQQGGFGFAEPCRACHGRGQVVDDPCGTCGASAPRCRPATVNVRVPAGIKDGAHAAGTGQGRTRTRRRPRRRPARHRARRQPPGVRSQGRPPDPDRADHLRRGCPGLDDHACRRWTVSR